MNPRSLPSPEAPRPLACRDWNGTPIHRRIADGYVNATAMCKANGRRWNDFWNTDRCTEYLEALSGVTGKPVTGHGGLIQVKQGGRGAQGTWVHPDVATELARWISPAFSVFVNQWFREEVERQQAPPAPGRAPSEAEQILSRVEGNKNVNTAIKACGANYAYAHDRKNVAMTGHTAAYFRNQTGSKNWNDFVVPRDQGVLGVGNQIFASLLDQASAVNASPTHCVNHAVGGVKEFRDLCTKFLSPGRPWEPELTSKRQFRGDKAKRQIERQKKAALEQAKADQLDLI